MLLDCAIIGDSIAVGIANVRRDCVVNARVGRMAEQQQPLSTRARVLVISLGSNNQNNVEVSLRRLREASTADLVIWVVPNTPHSSRETVKRLAAAYGDQTLDVRDVVSSDNVHPSSRGYQILARGVDSHDSRH
jgi:lysophospholipase L1-like esterase